jgi:hypothetical protein
MDSDSGTADQGNDREQERGSILQRIEEKLDRLLGPHHDEWRERSWAPLEPPSGYPGADDPSPRLFGGPPADAPGWDASITGPRFDSVDVGAVGAHGVDPVSSFDGAQPPMFNARSSAREYYLLSQARGRAHAGGASGYAEYRRRKQAELDREYADYCRDQQERFDRDFNAWRQKRGRAAQSADEDVGLDETGDRDSAQRR